GDFADARRHVAPAHDRRLLDRALRRDDRPRPFARAVRLRRSGDAAVLDRRADPPLHARRPGLGLESAFERVAVRADLQLAPDAAGVRALPPPLPPAADRPRGGAAAWLAPRSGPGEAAAAGPPRTARARERSCRPHQGSPSPSG